MKHGHLIVIAKDEMTVVQVEGVYSSNYSMSDLKDISQYWIERNQPNHSDRRLRSYICEIVNTYSQPKGQMPGLTETGKYLDLHINQLKLTVRSYNALFGKTCASSKDIRFVRDIVNLPDAELLRMPNLGRRSLNDIKAKLQLARKKVESNYDTL